MSYFQLNHDSYERLKSMIGEGDVLPDAWDFTPEVSNELLGAIGDENWIEYSKWFLGKDSTQSESSKEAYAYPFGGPNAKVYRQALAAIITDATAAGDLDIAQKAAECLAMIEERDEERAEAKMPVKSLILGTTTINIKAAETDAGGKKKLATFDMLAYSGKAMVLGGWEYPVVIDLLGLSGLNRKLPALIDHDPQKRFGHITAAKVTPDGLMASGVCSGKGIDAQNICAEAADGMPFQASVGATAKQTEFIQDGLTCNVNGQDFEGPIYIARKSVLSEISVLALGADDTTRTSIAAQKVAEGQTMNEFEKWLKAAGVDPAKITDAQKKILQAAFDAEIAAKKADPTPSPAPAVDPAIAATRTELAELRASIAESNRIASIKTVCAKEGNPTMTVEGSADPVSIEAHAIEKKWTATETELACLRAGRSPMGTGNNPRTPDFKINGKAVAPPSINRAIEAAFALGANVPAERAMRGLSEQEKDLATSRQVRDLASSWHVLGAYVAAQRGQHVRGGKLTDDDFREILAHPSERAIKAEGSFGVGFSTMSLSGITENIMNKALLAGYDAVGSIVENIAWATDTNDFKTYKRYRMTASGAMQPVGPSGELKSMGLQDESYPNAVKTDGCFITVTRQNLINDDMGALSQQPMVVGRQAALDRERAVLTSLMSGPSTVAPGASINQTANAFNFFSTGARNYLSGGSSPLSITSLTTAEQYFLEQKDANSDPILIMPGQLLVPPAIKVTAENLYNGNMLTVAALQLPASGAQTAAQVPNRQPHAGKFTPIYSPYLGTQFTLTGKSDTQWFLLPDTGAIAAGFAPVQIGYLRGQRTPIIERGEMMLSVLGIGLRCYYDFGVALHDYRCAVMSAGA